MSELRSRTRQFSVLLIILFGAKLLAAQQISKPPTPQNAATIFEAFIRAETKTREALNQYTFRRDVVLQTINDRGQVTGQYIRESQFIFDDRGNRIERVTFHPPSTIREMRITKEDIQDLAGGQLLGIDIAEINKYRLAYEGAETLLGKRVYAWVVEPFVRPDPYRMRERFFVGRVWIDVETLQIVKVRGIVEPQGKQRFPVFETWRELLTGEFPFPTRTEADDVLHFPKRDVHYRISVRYYDYKLFASKLKITETDEP